MRSNDGRSNDGRSNRAILALPRREHAQGCSGNSRRFVRGCVFFLSAVVSLQILLVLHRESRTFWSLPHQQAQFWRIVRNSSSAGMSDNMTLSENNDHNDSVVYFGDRVCFIEGLGSFENATDGCQCKTGWHGSACSIPEVVFQSSTPWRKAVLTLRSTPRRVVQAFPFNMEFEMLDLRFAELADVVDVFLILESNYTAYGTPKPLYLLDRFQSGMYREFANKVVYVLLDSFPQEGFKNGWAEEEVLRNYIGTHGLPKISGLLATDLFVLTDADELPSREALLFLKWHDGYTEPVTILYQWNVFGFYWRNPSVAGNNERRQRIPAVVTLAMLKYVFRYRAYFIRSAENYVQKHALDVNIYVKLGGRIASWTLGTDEIVAGWHCSWCLDPERIRNKLLSAQNGDFPRWGDYLEKTQVAYIKSLIARGAWFDDKSSFVAASVTGPKRLMDNEKLFRHLVTNIYLNDTNIDIAERFNFSR